MKRALLAACVTLAALAALGAGPGPGPGVWYPPGASIEPDVSGGAMGGEETLARLHVLREFAGLEAGQFRTRIWFDPFEGSDTGAGTYEDPLRSFRILKERCLDKPASRCTVKGRGRVFSPRTLTVTFGTPGPFAAGELVNLSGVGPDPSSAGTVVSENEGNKLVLSISAAASNDWGGGTIAIPEPLVGTIITGQQSGAVATVTDYEDTIVGLHSIVFDELDMTVATPTVITATGNAYEAGAAYGPFLWYNQTTMPTTTGATVTEGTTKVYVCPVDGNTFQLSTNSACTAARVNVSADGAGLNQLVPYFTGSVDSADQVAAVSTLNAACPSSRRGRICSLLESERPEWPWTIDAGGFYPAEIRSLIEPGFWPGYGSGGTYNPPTGYLIGHTQTTADLSQGWLGMQNGTIQNLSMDGFSALSGGKIVALNVNIRYTRDGASDRSQTGSANPKYNAHNSLLQTTGTPAVAGNAGSVVYWINAGESIDYQGSDAGSGGALNTNESGVVRILTRGMIRSDVLSTDTGCAGAPCQSSLMVLASGDTTIVGPMELRMGPTGTNNVFTGSGTGNFLGLYRVLINGSGNYVTDDITIPTGLYIPPTTVGDPSNADLNEVTVRFAGFGGFMKVCKVADGAFFRMTARNLLLDGLNGNYSNVLLFDCGQPPTTTDTIENSYIDVRGIIDHNDVDGTTDAYLVAPNYRLLGTRATANTFLGDINTALVAAGKSVDQWRWFEDGSSESGAGTDGSSYGTDPYFRCDAANACWGGGGGATYDVSLRSTQFTDAFDDTCLPADVLGTPICGLRLEAANTGAR